MHRLTLPLLLTLCLLAACDKPTRISSASEIAQPDAPPTAVLDGASAWLGRWTGPEGTYLEVLNDKQRHKVAIRDLDGVRTFEASSTYGGLTFERDGTKETIKSGSGNDTGMKWLLDKTNCLVVRSGEGYCRE